ncbi:cytochrome P450 [Kitasatospora sp. NPDC101235]|uniref:cytochrome P450 n=1 Tax=Kitasatospora sp. NPDC101235 TaxID=3364101 RepID=UPI003805B14A
MSVPVRAGEPTAPSASLTLPLRRSGCPFAPPPEYAGLTEEHPLHQVRLYDGSTTWVITRLAEARALLTDPRLSAEPSRPGFPIVEPGQAGLRTEPNPPFVKMDPPRHTSYRRMLIGEFTLRRLNALRPRIQAVVDRLLDQLEAGPRPADLVEALALPVPSIVTCELLGVPYADHGFFESRARTAIRRGSSPAQRQRAFIELLTYLDRLLVRKDRDPQDDLLSRLVVEQERTGNLTHDQLVSAAMLLLTAGHETSANMISLGTLMLLRHPEQLAALRADPALLPGAVEELLRYLSIADTVPTRVAVEDIEVAGRTIRAGEGVVVLAAAVDHDPRAFERPAEFDITRSARHHIAFGYGIHQCLGQNLVRIELEIVFASLFERFPDLRVAVPEEALPFRHDAELYGVWQLPVTW